MAQTFDQERAAWALRKLASSLADDEDVTAAQSIADYIESTAPYDPRRMSAREVYAEIAMAYVAGLEHASGESKREVGRALRLAGLAI
jgi:hypothetical protein